MKKHLCTCPVVSDGVMPQFRSGQLACLYFIVVTGDTPLDLQCPGPSHSGSDREGEHGREEMNKSRSDRSKLCMGRVINLTV